MPPPITLNSSLPASDLAFESMTATAGLSMLGEMQVDLVSKDPNLSADDLLGMPFGVEVALPGTEKRQFNGVITGFSMGAHRGRYYGYRATVRPWLWLLTRTSDCRVFQQMTVPDIVKAVFDDHSVANFEFKPFRKYRKWDYCVQYRESDFNFVARLLEHEGIYWYFEHGDGEHKLVLVDAQNSHDAVPGHEALPYFENAAAAPPDTEFVSNWSFSHQVQSGRAALRSYDFKRPHADLGTQKSASIPYDMADYEVFDFQGDYTQFNDGQQLAENRIEELEAGQSCTRGTSNSHSIEVGRLLTLARHPRDDQNAQHLITALTIHAQVSTPESGGGEGDFECRFEAIPAGRQFRPPRRTRKPVVQGPQSAVVVGPVGEEIFTDEYGRVKIQFYWDRYGNRDEKSSCWVRVSYPWAGKNFGAIHIPRVGQEVVVSFLEGDPDQPLITGRVYNAEQMPPWPLPDNATQSGILTRSSKGGSYGNANAIRFEDKKGAEQLWIHAERNQDIEVEADETHWVGHDRSKTVDNNETNHIKNDRTDLVDNNELIGIGGNRTEVVAGDENITIGGSRVEAVEVNETVAVGGDELRSIGGSRNLTVGAHQHVQVGSNQTTKIGGNEKITVSGSRTEKIDGTLTQQVAGEIKITTPQKMTILASGGYNVLAPAGHKEAKSIYDQLGAKATMTFATETSITGLTRSITAMQMSAQAVSLSHSVMSSQTANLASAVTGVKFDQVITDISSGALTLGNFGLTLLG